MISDSFNSSFVVSRLIIAVISESDTTGVGTRTDKPLNFPWRLGIVNAAAFDAPVVLAQYSPLPNAPLEDL